MGNKAIIKTTGVDVEGIIQATELADTTKHQYIKAVRNYLDTGGSLLDAVAISIYAQKIKGSSKAFLKAGLKKVFAGLMRGYRSRATVANIDKIQVALMKIEAVFDAVEVPKQNGTKTHTWLTRTQVRRIMQECSTDLAGKRDWIVLGLLLGAGLRRRELVELKFENLKTQPMNNGKTRVILDILGKGNKKRAVPIRSVLTKRINEWSDIVGGEGLIVRSLGRKQVIGDSLSAVGVFHIVRKYGRKIGVETLAPHDLRRTYAQLGFDAGVSIAQISILLGHATVAQTQKYLNLEIDVDVTVSDFIPLNGD